MITTSSTIIYESGTALFSVYDDLTLVSQYTYVNSIISLTSRPIVSDITLNNFSYNVQKLRLWIKEIRKHLSPSCDQSPVDFKYILEKKNGKVTSYLKFDVLTLDAECENNLIDMKARPAQTRTWCEFEIWINTLEAFIVEIQRM